MSTLRPTLSPSDTGSIRQSPFRRQNSHSPAPTFQRASTPTSSPTKTTHLSPTKTASLSPEKASPFVRRPSQIGGAGHASERPVSPFARPASGLGVPASPSFRGAAAARKASVQSGSDESAEVISLPPASPKWRATPPEAEKENVAEPLSPAPESPSPFDGTHPHGPFGSPVVVAAPPSQANLRPTAHRIPTSSTVSTIRQPSFTPTARPAATTPASRSLPTRTTNPTKTPYSALPPSLLHNLRESFEVLDPNATGTLTSTSLPPLLDQLGLPHTPSSLKDFFPASGPAQLNLATYLDTLSSPLTSLSAPDELLAAFGAFDIDDSGQIDVAELREALLSTAPEPGEEDFRLSGREADAVISDFVGRRAFGARGLGAGKAGNKGEVFRYRDFMGSLGGGGGSGSEGVGEQGMAV